MGHLFSLGTNGGDQEHDLELQRGQKLDFFFPIDGAWDLTQGSVHTRQALYY